LHPCAQSFSIVREGQRTHFAGDRQIKQEKPGKPLGQALRYLSPQASRSSNQVRH
jgi:hypothetical protein